MGESHDYVTQREKEYMDCIVALLASKAWGHTSLIKPSITKCLLYFAEYITWGWRLWLFLITSIQANLKK